MTLHEIAKAMEEHETVWYTDDDGEGYEAEIKYICDNGEVVVVVDGVDRIRVSPEELDY